MQGIIALVKETPESFLPLPPREESEETAVYKADTKSAGALILNFSASRTMKKKKKVCGSSHSVYGIFLEQSKWTKIMTKVLSSAIFIKQMLKGFLGGTGL